jgi:hypothetical protein
MTNFVTKFLEAGNKAINSLAEGSSGVVLESGVKSVSDAYDAGKKLRFKEEEERKKRLKEIQEMEENFLIKKTIEKKYLPSTVDLETEKEIRKKLNQGKDQPLLGDMSINEFDTIADMEKELFKINMSNKLVFGKNKDQSYNDIVTQNDATKELKSFHANTDKRNAETNETAKNKFFDLARELGYSEKNARLLSSTYGGQQAILIEGERAKKKHEADIRAEVARREKEEEGKKRGETYVGVLENYGLTDSSNKYGLFEKEEFMTQIFNNENTYANQIIDEINSGKIIIPVTENIAGENQSPNIQPNMNAIEEINQYLPRNKRIKKQLPFIVLDSMSDDNFFELSGDDQRYQYALGVVNDTIELSDEFWDNMSDNSRGRIEANLTQALRYIFKANTTQAKYDTKLQAFVLNDDTKRINWSEIGFNWRNMPDWAKSYVAKKFKLENEIEFGTRKPVNFTNVTPDNKVVQVTKWVDVEITPDKIEKLYGTGSKKTKDEYLNDVMLAYSIHKGVPISRFMNMKSDTAIRRAESLQHEAIAFANGNPDLAMSTIISSGLYYDRNGDSFVPSDEVVKRVTEQLALKAYNKASESNFNNLRDNLSEGKDDGGQDLYEPVKPEFIARNINYTSDFDGEGYYNDLILYLASGIRYGSLPPRSPLMGVAERPGADTRFEIETAGANAVNYRKAQGIDEKSVRQAAEFAGKGMNAINALEQRLDETGVGGALAVDLGLFLDGIKSFPKELISALGLSEDGQGSNADFGSKQLKENFLRQFNLAQTADGRIKDPVFRALYNELEQGYDTAIKYNDKAGGLAQQRALHAITTYFVAAALQGEGGKAISDADREFVIWALSRNTFSNVRQRKAALNGVKIILGRIHAVNKGLLSQDVRVAWAADNIKQYYGQPAMDIEYYPAYIQKKYFKDFNANVKMGKPDDEYRQIMNEVNQEDLKKQGVVFNLQNLQKQKNTGLQIIGLSSTTSQGIRSGNRILNLDYGGYDSANGKPANPTRYEQFKKTWGSDNNRAITNLYRSVGSEEKTKIINFLQAGQFNDMLEAIAPQS